MVKDILSFGKIKLYRNLQNFAGLNCIKKLPNPDFSSEFGKVVFIIW